MAGLVGEFAQFIYDAAPRQSRDIALAGALAFLAGICGRAYMTPTGAGANIYLLLLASSGMGKDAVSGAIGKLIEAIKQVCPSVVDFRGPGELASGPALIRWLANTPHPCVFSILGEIGVLIQMMAAKNAPSHYKALRRALLILYSKSDRGKVFDASAYSEKEKNISALPEPSYTLFGETAPESFDAAVDETLIKDGFIPRCITWPVGGQRSYLNETADEVEPSPGLVSGTANVVAYCLTLMQRGERLRVGWTDEAKAKFTAFDRWTTDEIIRAPGEAWRELWNRAHLNAMKLASLRAIGENYLQPVITLDHTMWATELVVGQIRNIIRKIESGDIGEEAGNENKQLAHMKRIIVEMFNDDISSEKLEKTYKANIALVNNGVIENSYLHRRLATLAAFQPRPKQAIKDTIQLMKDNGWIADCDGRNLGSNAKCYKIIKIHEFADCEQVKDKAAFISAYVIRAGTV